jgi:hypothetical protein
LVVAVAVASAVAGCDGSQPTAGTAPEILELTASSPQTTVHEIGSALALALTRPEARRWLLDMLERSPFVEHRLPLTRLLRADTSAALRGFVAGTSLEGRLAPAAVGLPDLELYFPIDAHRARARLAQGEIQVAVREASDSFMLFRATAPSLKVGEQYDPGDRPTLVLGRTEIAYDDSASSIRGGARTASGMRDGTAQFGGRMNAECDPEVMTCDGGVGGDPPQRIGGDTLRRTEFYFIQLNEHMEGPLMGLNEIEVFGRVNNAYFACGSVTGIQWGTAYAVTYLSSDITRMIATAVPIDTFRLRLEAFEDDDDRCVRRSGDDVLGNWNTGITQSQYGIAYTTDAPGRLRLAVGRVWW